MLIAIFADIHANRQAFEACLAQARDLGAERNVLLGDYVGYGADPEWAVETVMDLVEKGAMAVRGNHDNAVSDPREQLNVEAQIAIEWTRGELGSAERKFLRAVAAYAARTMTVSTFMPTPAVRKVGAMSWTSKMPPAA